MLYPRLLVLAVAALFVFASTPGHAADPDAPAPARAKKSRKSKRASKHKKSRRKSRKRSVRKRSRARRARPSKDQPDRPATPLPKLSPGANAARAKQLLETLRTAPAAADRLDAAKQLAALRPPAVATLAEFLARTRESADADRRKVLQAIHAQVPNRKGRFYQPGRLTPEQQKKQDELDWLARLVKLADQPGLGDTIADVAAIRALAASQDWNAAAVMFNFAFADDGVAYRDECGRYLRDMAPYSLPALIRNAGIRRHTWKYRSQIRYATYQLERLDRQAAGKAVQATGGDERLRAELFHAFRDVHYRDAVRVVLDWVDADSPLVRAAARQTWMAYVTGKKPPDPPKRKLKLPGGKETKKKKKLWLNYRELAQNALYERAEQVLGSKPAGEALGPLSTRLFAHYDAKRAQAETRLVDDALQAAKAKTWDKAIPAMDRILARNPNHERRGAFAEAFYEYAIYLEDQKKWVEAAHAYGKANTIARRS